MFRTDTGREEFRRRVPARLLQAAKGKKIRVIYDGKYGEPAQDFEIRVSGQIKIGYRTKNPVLEAERKAVAIQLYQNFIASLEMTVKHLPDHQIHSLAEQAFANYCKHCDRKENPVSNLEALVSYYRYYEDANDRTETSYKRYRGILPFTDAPTFQEWIDRFAEFDEQYMMAYKDCDEVTPQDTAEQALEKQFGVAVTWWLCLQNIKVFPKDKIKVMYAVSQIADRHTYIGFGRKEQIELRFDYDEIIKRSGRPAYPRTMSEVVDRWKSAKKRASNTLSNWLPKIQQFRDYIGHDDITKVTEQNLLEWQESLTRRTPKLNPRTISCLYMSCLKSIFSFAFDRRWIAQNPAAKIKLEKSVHKDERKMGYNDNQICHILYRSTQEEDSVHRWLSTLLVYTGARVGEVAQLWADQVRLEDGFHVIDIRPSKDGGSIKNESSERMIPIHSDLIRSGFLHFVESRRGKPLFYDVRPRKPDQMHPLYTVCRKNTRWIRTLDLDFTRCQPNHAVRHWFKTKLSKLKVQDSIADQIQGHASANEGGNYRHRDLKTMSDAIELIKIQPREMEHQTA